MLKNLILLLLVLLALGSKGQSKPVLIFDLVNGTLDSITNISFDTTLVFDQTDHYIGNFNPSIELLEQTPPLSNVYPNSQFTYKKKASVDFELSDYPIRTSVKIFSINNDSLQDLCSGSIISRKHVLTAAHCVSNFNSNTLHQDSMLVCPIFDNGAFSSDFSCSAVSKIYVFKDWSLAGEDLAVLELEEAIGEATGWLGVGFNDMDSVLSQSIFYKFSYPATTILAIDSNEYNGDSLYYNYGRADIFSSNSIGINYTSGIPGESGSSIIKVVNGMEYTTYGALSVSNALHHSRINNWRFYALEHIIHDDLTSNIEAEYSKKEVFIYPNPTDGRIWLRGFAENEVVRMHISDQLGRVCWGASNYRSSSGIDISSLPKGLYHLQVVAMASTESIPFMKNR